MPEATSSESNKTSTQSVQQANSCSSKPTDALLDCEYGNYFKNVKNTRFKVTIYTMP